ncbi:MULTISPECIES: NADPH-dependent FMN reductase [Heyndrickxia]|jgi:NAD(P)H-dependent FMN reductase|uniref:NADPH-dependent oxidoreductase n=1 Tax=Heyndrickxia oleronia TaxID=38875 RepID=A0A8E2I485_9BACI|nr:NADPH-dependent FMN reductase [Heyndrickxia oleronia]NYV63918.1 NAD(P)H-dependent oxidoreductase [Bacillus sp. Gen3]OJH16177.1 NADPH-dependent oxidoreductase [Bacillus obstructivus]MBU5212744.1 NAD(P)H-dependent oxidoreductase [Heyndrickxia oleronia]MCI1590621.1 NAD(P)H-dependent oxidoreductase [Heyndrickxia oleronia]MCI1614249.1 NAD(P)H-dependent oxidoreductase [Heyndrickxia oleronia]
MSFLNKLFGKTTKEEEIMTEKLNIGIILGSTRQGRLSPQVGEWVKGIADQRGDANYEIVDIADFKLPFLGEADAPGIAAWNEKLAELDGFVFIVQEYNHSITGALKNALDLAREAWNNKAAGIVSYGSTGGARAAEHLRGILGELMIADVRTHPTLSLFTDFENGTVFKPQDLHLDNINLMLDQVNTWSRALKTIR